MKRVLFLSYFFPPVGGAGVQRSVKFVRYLGASGYEPIVVTGPGSIESRWSPSDASLASEVPDDIQVERIAAREPAASTGWAARRERWLRRTTPFADWWVDETVALASRMSGIDLVYASMSPFETSIAAAELSRRLGVPWVADLRDPWALDEMMVYPSRLHRRLELERMRRSLASAAHVVMNTPEACARLRELRGYAGASISTIPNGYDAADFASPPSPRDDEMLRIVHSGYLHTELGREHRRRRVLRRVLGGGADVDILTRSVVYLTQAIRKLRAADPSLASMIELHLVGVTSEADRETAATEGVVIHGYLEHDRSIALLRSADLLFLPMQNLPPGQRATIVPGKTYEYLAAGVPILAAVPDGDARDILNEAHAADLCRPDDVDGMVAALRHAVIRKHEGRRLRPDPAVVERFERRRLTSELARVFDRVLERGGRSDT